MFRGPVTSDHKWLNVPDVARYNAIDVMVTARLATPLVAELRRTGSALFWDQEVWPLVPAVLGMQARGIEFDSNTAFELRLNLDRELAEVDQAVIEADPTGELSKPTGKSPNGLGSPRRVATA